MTDSLEPVPTPTGESAAAPSFEPVATPTLTQTDHANDEPLLDSAVFPEPITSTVSPEPVATPTPASPAVVETPAVADSASPLITERTDEPNPTHFDLPTPMGEPSSAVPTTLTQADHANDEPLLDVAQPAPITTATTEPLSTTPPPLSDIPGFHQAETNTNPTGAWTGNAPTPTTEPATAPAPTPTGYFSGRPKLGNDLGTWTNLPRQPDSPVVPATPVATAVKPAPVNTTIQAIANANIPTGLDVGMGMGGLDGYIPPHVIQPAVQPTTTPTTAEAAPTPTQAPKPPNMLRRAFDRVTGRK